MKRYSYTILVSLLAVVVGCRDMGHTPGRNDGGQVLDLSVSIEDGASKAPITGAAFANGTHLFGLAVTKADGVTAYETGAGNVWASAVVSGAAQTWSYKWGAMSAAGTVLPLLYGGDLMQVAGYYPYNTSAGILAGRDAGRLNVPFDLTTTAEQSNQTDVLVSGVQAVGYASGARQSMALSFRHVYALLEFQVKLKREGVAASITKVEVCNKAGKTFLSNKGFFSPYTGVLTASTAGNVSFATATALTATGYATIRVMVPPTLLAGYADGDIYVQLYDGGAAGPKQFPILKSYLTQSGVYGFVGGGRYTYKLLYENTAYGSITVVGWQSSTPAAETLGGGDISGILPIAGWGNTTLADATLGSGPPYIEINGLRWAVGNLVASGNNSCKIGSSTDYGVYFQFGSLVGWTGGASGDGVGTGSPALAVKVQPLGYSGTAVWGTVGRYIEGAAGTGYGLPATDDLPTGIGDPCRVYLGAPWRTPTAGEWLTLLGASGANTNKTVPLKVNSYDLSFPASGYRFHDFGAFNVVGSAGYCWSSSVGSATNNGLDLYFGRSIVYPQYENNRSNGFPVRCVEPAPTVPNPPTADDYVEINGLKWAKGNLVAVNGTNCKVGAPSDHGLYFQFGSLIGYKGGALANGGTGVGSNPYTTNDTYWNGASSYSLSNDVMVWPSALTTTPPAAWPANNGSSVGDRTTVVDQLYFNYDVAPYSSTSQGIRGFELSFPGDAGSGNLGTGRYAKWGVGDPCTYYLGGTWRLPTGAEYAALCNNKTGLNTNYSWSDVGGGTWVTSPTNGGNLQGTKLFFPASGSRHNSHGSFYNVTLNGYYWSSSVYNATFGLGWNFYRDWVTPQTSNSRSNGFPVRCVAD